METIAVAAAATVDDNDVDGEHGRITFVTSIYKTRNIVHAGLVCVCMRMYAYVSACPYGPEEI